MGCASSVKLWISQISVAPGAGFSVTASGFLLAGYKTVNARTSWDAGVIDGYGTDTGYLPKAGLDHELKSLNLMFSMQDIIKLAAPNTASYIEMSNQLGTLETGKLADMSSWAATLSRATGTC